MVYADEHSAGKSVKVVPVDKAERNQFSLSNEELVELAKQALIIEKHYGHAMDIEWAKDGDDATNYYRASASRNRKKP
jgi:pyruvate,water dikinase